MKAKAQAKDGAHKPYVFPVATNRRAWHDFHVEEDVEAGIALHGSEVKSLRLKQVDFTDSYALVDNGQCWLMGLRLSKYDKSHVQTPDPVRRRPSNSGEIAWSGSAPRQNTLTPSRNSMARSASPTVPRRTAGPLPFSSSQVRPS